MRLRTRSDLKAEKQRYQGRVYWVVKDPVGLNYFRFQEEEYAILKMLDGQSSLDQVKRRFERQFPPQKITVEELDRLVGMLHRSNLVISDVMGQGPALKNRGEERKRKEFFAKWTNVLAIRFKGIDPDRILTWMYPSCRWLFSPAIVWLCLCLMLTALTLVVVQWDVFRGKLPGFHQFFDSENWLWLGITLSVTKVIHEFGHGLSCKHFGGECHEMGVMFLVLTPCLYCNVSDSWMLPNKWHRAAIGLAGMYIEVVIASICTLIWWFTEPGLLHYLSLNVMFISSVSTILFNANPLLRYDGYYILSDIAEIPNLRQKSSAILSRKLGHWCLGIEPPPDPFLPERNQGFFALYTVAAAVYRWVIVFSILWFLNQVFKPYGLQIVGQLIAMASVYSLAIMPLWKLFKFFHTPGRIEKVKKVPMYATLAFLATVLGAVLLIPFPFHVVGTFALEPHAAESVYVEMPGKLKKIAVQHQDHVQEGDSLLELENIELELTTVRLQGQLEQQNSMLDSLYYRAISDSNVLLEIPAAEETLATIQGQLKKREEERGKLKLSAPAAGTVLPAPEVRSNVEAMDQLPTWEGSPLEEKNLNAFLTDDVLVCQIGDPSDLEAVIAIDQADISFISVGQRVELFLDQLPGRRFVSRIDQIAKDDLEVSPRGLSGKAGGDLATQTDAAGREKPMSTTYQASARLQDKEGVILIGTRGTAKIDAGSQTAASRLWRYLSRTFNFEL